MAIRLLRKLPPVLLAGLAAALPAVAAPAGYRLDPEHSFASFEVVHFGTSTIRGRLGRLEGEAVLDLEARRGELGVRLPTASVSTGVPALDARLRGADVFDSAGFPEAFFVASRFEFDGERLAAVRGEFTLRGTSRPLSLRAQRFGCRTDAEGEVCGGDFEAELLRSEFGLTHSLPFVADRVRLLIQVEGRRR